MLLRIGTMLLGLVCFGTPLRLAAQDPAAATEPKQRIRQIRDLAKLGSNGLPKIVPFLTDAANEVRLEAVKAISEIGGPASVDPLIAATRDNDPFVQIRATDGLVNYYVPGYLQSTLGRAVTAVKARFTDTNTQVVEAYIVIREDVIAALAKLARGGVGAESRANAARALGILRGKAALPELLEALKTKDDDIIYESLIAIQKIREPKTGPNVIFLLRDLTDRIQIAAIETVGLLRTKESVPELRRAYENGRNIKVRRAAAFALAMIADPAARDTFKILMTDRDDQLRSAGAEGLGRIRDSVDLLVLSTAFNDEKKMAPRLAAAFGMVAQGQLQLSEMSALQYLVNTLNSRAYREVAEAYLVELARDAAVRGKIQPLLAKGTREEKIGLGRVLARSGDKDAVPFLEPLTKDPDEQVAQESLRSLRNLKARLP